MATCESRRSKRRKRRGKKEGKVSSPFSPTRELRGLHTSEGGGAGRKEGICVETYVIFERRMTGGDNEQDSPSKQSVDEVPHPPGGLPHLVSLRVVLNSLWTIVGRSFDSESFLDLSCVDSGSSWCRRINGRRGRRRRGRVVDAPLLRRRSAKG